VHGHVDVLDDRRTELECRLLGRRDLSHRMHRQLLGELRRRVDMRPAVPDRQRPALDRSDRQLRMIPIGVRIAP
jgi:hypothetical protein